MLTLDCISSILPSSIEKIYVAYSGGIDSHVLLHLCCSVEQLKSKITAVYVHHGLQQDADQWALHCQSTALDLGVDFQCLKVNAKKTVGESLEEVARDARYNALKPLLAKNDVLLLAQHCDDQLETVLLQLFRGAGVQGLSGMPASTSLGLGTMYRPLLDIPKKWLNDYAALNDLHWVEDSSNQDNAFDRNYLRNNILPQLKQRWPALAKTVSRSARHCANSHQFNQQLVVEVFNTLYDECHQTLNITKLIELQNNQQSLVIRQWFAMLELRMPSESLAEKIIKEVCKARKDRNPEIQGKEFIIRRYRNELYCLKPFVKEYDLLDQPWPVEEQYLVLNNALTLKLTETEQGISKQHWLNSQVEVKFRKGSEKIRLKGREGRHSLKKLYQEKGIPPWERANIPLIYLNGKLAVVVGLFFSEDFLCKDKQQCYQIEQCELGNES